MPREPQEDPWAWDGGRGKPGLLTWLIYVIPALLMIGIAIYYMTR